MKEMRDTVKALVWIGCLIGVTLLNVLLGEAIGFRLGYVPVFLIVSGLSTAICKGMGYDEKKPQETPKTAVPSSRPDWVCASCGTTNKGSVGSCQGCGVTREWSEKKSGGKKAPELPKSAPKEEPGETVTVSSASNPVQRYPGNHPAADAPTEITPRAHKPAVIITPVAPEKKPKPEPVAEATRWVCPGCGLVHSRQLSSCFHCGTPQSKAYKFV